MTDTLLIAIVAIITAEFILERTLSYLNIRHMRTALPEALKDIYDEQQYANAQRYNKEKAQVGLLGSLVSYLLTLWLVVGGGYAIMDTWVSGISTELIWQSLAFFGLVALVSDLLALPFDYYNTFVIEEKYGFNRMSIGTFLSDKIKGWILGALLGGGLLAAFLWFYQAFPDTFWLYAWAVFMVVVIALNMFYTNLIVPMFNKLSPLEDGSLRQKIEAYAKSVDFPLSNIMVMDGSKRSSKANAYFSGMGKSKNIVLFDTLIEKLTEEEIVAVLAHEVGHYKRRHTLQVMILTAGTTLFTLFLMSVVVNMPELSIALGAQSPKLYLNLITFFILFTPISLVTGLVMNLLSRKNEYEADAFAGQTYQPEALYGALKKLSVDALSNLTPHPAYVFFHYSHPTLLQRGAKMTK